MGLYEAGPESQPCWLLMLFCFNLLLIGTLMSERSEKSLTVDNALL
jgi:hypothetical protein